MAARSRLAFLPFLLAHAALALDPARSLRDYGHDVWQTEQGLPQSSVNAFIQSHEGYLWIGTFDGLTRFDGVDFVRVESGQDADRRSGRVLTLAEDAHGAIWVGTEGSGLWSYKDGRRTVYGRAEGLKADVVQAVLPAADGTLLMGTATAGLVRLRDDRFESVGPAELSDTSISCLLESDGVLWIGTGRGLWKASGGIFKKVVGLETPSIAALHEGPDRVVWVATSVGLAHVAPPGGTILMTHADGLPSDNVTAVWADQHDVYFGMGDAGLGLLRDGQLSFFREGDGLSSDEVGCLLGDREGSLWIGTRAAGLNRLKDVRCTTYGVPEGLSHDVALCVLQDRAGALWIGTNCGGLNRYADGRFQAFTWKEGLTNDCVWSLHEARNGALWIGTWGGGVSIYRNGVFNTLNRDQGLPSDVVLAITEDVAGVTWLGTSGGLARYEKGKIEVFTTAQGLSSDDVRCLLPARDGSLYVGTYGGGLCRYKDGRLLTYRRGAGLSSDDVRCLHEDGDGVLWIGTFGGGLDRFDGATFTSFRRRDGLYDDLVSEILEDDLGNLWMSCNRGIFRVEKDDLDAFRRKERSYITSYPYGTQDGMRSRECNGGSQPAGARTRDGMLWFPTIRGVVEVDPRPHTTQDAPNVLVEEVQVDREHLHPPPLREAGGVSRLALPAGKRSLEIHYTAISFTAPERVRYEYRLDGSSGTGGSWIEAGPRRAAYFTNLRPGNYTFRARAAGESGNWSEQEASLDLYLPPHLWETTSFYVIATMVTGFLGYTAYQLRVLNLKAKERELRVLVDERTQSLREEKQRTESAMILANQANRAKSQFLANTSHELRTPLNAIIGYSELLREEVQDLEQPQLAEDLRRIEGAGRQLLGLVDDILDISRLESGRMDLCIETFEVAPIMRDVERSARLLAERNGNRLDVTEPDDAQLGTMTSDPVRLRQVLEHLLENAAKFTKGGWIHLEARRETGAGGEWLQFQVRDTGIGMSSDQAQRLFQPFTQGDASMTRPYGGSGLGLAISKRLCELMGGEITVTTAPALGSTLTVRLPVSLPPEQSD